MENMWKKILRFLYKLDNLLHVVIAIALLFFAFIAVFNSFYDFRELSYISIIDAVSDIFLTLILAELLWPIIKFFKKGRILIKPFFICRNHLCNKKIINS
jgi:uncharacterized membrane protein (DUF373 family)